MSDNNTKKNQKNTISKEKIILAKLIFILIIILIIFIHDSMNANLTNNPELQKHNNQTLKLLIPKKNCKCTLFFTSNIRNKTIDKENDKFKIIQYKNKKNYFVTYYLDDIEYFQFDKLLEEHGLIKSNNTFSDNNIYLSKKSTKLIESNNKLIKFNKFKKFNRFFGYHALLKDSLYMNYQQMKKEFNEDYNFMAETYNYPDDKEIIIEKFRNYKFNTNDLWLVKPTHKSGGSGIEILESLKKIKLKNYLLNKYITNLDLINNKKYDLRLFILVTGLKPLRIYFNQEGLVRIAANNFTLNEEFIKNKFIHLTNVGVNLLSKDFIAPDNSLNEEANTWNLYMYERRLKKLNVDFNEVKTKISDIIIKSIISVYQNLILEQNKNNINDINFYDLLGYDIIITKNFEPILLEINSGPSIVYHNDLEKNVKTNLVVDMLNILGISLFNKGLTFFKNHKKKISVDENVKNAICELNRPRGDFQLIFPLKENIDKYKKFFKGRNTEENKLFWKLIQNEK